MFKSKKKFVAGLLLVWVGLPMTGYAQEEKAAPEQGKIIPGEIWNANFQATYIWQKKSSFDAPYTGANSLRNEAEHAYSFTATAFLGYRPWKGGELYFNPEAIQAVPFSELHGLAGLTNGEQQKTSGPNPTWYRARLYLKQTFGFGGGADAVESGPNQLAGMVDKRRLVVTIGNLALVDLFDNNAYAKDPRSQFFNWAFFANGAYDFAADARGYTIGAAAEYYDDGWAVRIGRFEEPLESNGLPLDSQITKHHGDQIEVEHSHTIGDQPGKIRLLAFRNKAVMGRYADAMALAASNGGVPDVTKVRKENAKVGYGFSAEQSLRSDIGIFARASWADGQTETYSFTEIERAISAGVAVKGDRWGRAKDTFGLALAQNGLDQIHRQYLSLGGIGAFIGDGRLSYRPERIVETYYNVNVGKSAWLAIGFQHIDNPAYNADRGPVNVSSVRLHAEL